MQDNFDVEQVGCQIVLLSSYIGGDWCMQQRYQKAMAINWALEKPTLFITMTANLHWSEITQELLLNQKANDCLDIVSQVFYLKVQFLLNNLKKTSIFGWYAGSVYTI